jgi:hypothetical protein
LFPWKNFPLLNENPEESNTKLFEKQDEKKSEESGEENLVNDLENEKKMRDEISNSYNGYYHHIHENQEIQPKKLDLQVFQIHMFGDPIMHFIQKNQKN